MDMGIWRQRTESFDGFVIRLFGSERLLTLEEWKYLRMLMDSIDCGQKQALGEDYTRLAEIRRREAEGRKIERIDLISLGLVSPPTPLKRRA